MKKYHFFQWVFYCLLIHISGYAQYITYPVQGSVFQQNASEQATVSFSFNEINSYNKTVFYRIKKSDGSIVKDRVVLSNPTFTNGGGLKGYYVTETLTKGWYIVEYYHEWQYLFGLKTANRRIESKEFGVGDVYFVAGQSNASGFYEIGIDEPYTYSDQNTFNANWTGTPNIRDQTDNIQTRTLSASDNGAITKGLPTNTTGGFVQLTKTAMPIYPNGISSWCWAPLGNEMANHKNTPTLFLNLAKANTSLLYDWVGYDRNNASIRFDKNSPNTLIGKFYQTLGFYGNILGAKSVLWHQGERDSQILTGLESSNDKLPSDIENKYNSYLGELIDDSRSKTGLVELPWFVSKVSYTSRGNNISNSCIDNVTTTGYKDKIFNGTLYSYQTKSGDTKVFQGVRSDFIDGDDYEGVETNFNYSMTDCIRARLQRIHYSDSWLGKLGHAWYNAITNNYSNAVGKPSTELLRLTAVSKSGNDFTFTVQPPSSGAITAYYWCKNDVGINNSQSTMGNTNTTAITLTAGERLICYAKDASGRFYASQPFIRNDCANCREGSSIFSTNPTSLNFAAGGETKSITFNGAINDWDLQNVPSWITNIVWDDATQRLLITAGSTTSAQSGSIQFVEVGTTNILTTLNISQSATSNATYLTDLPYTYFTGDGYTPKKDLSVINNTLRMGGTHPSVGQSYSKGVGTHSFMTLTYNLNGQYTNLTGLVGIDDEVDATSDANTHTAWASIELDGVEVWNSGTVLKTNEAPRNINISVAGKNQIKIITNTGNGGTYNDHVDWVNMILTNGNTCTTQAPTPINVGANPAIISAGQSSTLQATCTTGTPVWSSGSNVVSPTVTTTYTVNCVNGNCPISPSMQTTVTVTSNNGCSAVTDGLVMGTWTLTGSQLVARRINTYNAFYLTQRNGTNPENFVVRGSQMLQRPDVSLTNNSYYNLTGCFSYSNGGLDGIIPPNLSNPINLNVNGTSTAFNLNISQDGTNYYVQSTNSPATCNGCIGYFDGVWCPVAAGWSKDGAGNQTNLDYWIDGVKVASNIPPNNYRADVGGQFGFNYTFPSQYLNGQNHEIRVRFASTMIDLNGSPKIFNCTGGNMRVANSANSLESEYKDNQSLIIYPNPTDDKLTVSFYMKNASKVSFKIIDMKGSQKEEFSFDAPEGNHQFEIDVNSLPAGSYLLKGILENKLNIRRFVIER